jgi:hypothetical protein
MRTSWARLAPKAVRTANSLPRARGAGQQQAGHVGTGDQQHSHRRSERDPDRSALLTHGTIRERLYGHRISGVGRGMFLLQLLSDGNEVSPRLFHGRIRLQATDAVKPGVISTVHILVTKETPGHPHLRCVPRKTEVRWHHTRNGIHLSAQDQRLIQSLGPATIPSRPKSVANQHRPVSSGSIIGGGENAA